VGILTASEGAHLPNPKLYARSWLVAVILALLTLFALRPVNPPALSDQPTSFDGRRALADLRALAQGFPKRTAGSDADTRATIWLSERIKAIGLQPHFDQPAPVRIDGRETAVQNMWAVSKGRNDEVILLIANRDSPPLSTQGADDNASGVAALLELARVFSVQSHQRTLVFLWSDGDAYGALGAGAFAEEHPDLAIRAAIALRRIGLAGAGTIRLNGWSAGPRVAPAWLWALANSAAKAEGHFRAPLPNIVTQLIRLAVPVGGGSQAPFVARGIPALSLSVAGDVPRPEQDTTSTVSASALRRVGRTVERMVTTLDGLEGTHASSGGTVFFSRSRTLPGIAVKLAIVMLLAPLVLIAFDLLAAARRRRTSLGPAWLLYLLRLAPWVALLALVYFANLVSLLPRSPGAIIPPESWLAHHPRYLRAFVLLVILVGVALYAHAVERKLLRRRRVPREDTVVAIHVVAALLGFLLLLGNPFSVVLVLPAAILWPLARAGPWTRSRLPAWAGLAALAVALVYYALGLNLGVDVWWYFFVLLENGTVPVGAALIGAAFIAAAVHLGHHLHGQAAPPGRRGLRWAAGPAEGEGTAMTQTGALGSTEPGERSAPSGRAQ